MPTLVRDPQRTFSQWLPLPSSICNLIVGYGTDTFLVQDILPSVPKILPFGVRDLVAQFIAGSFEVITNTTTLWRAPSSAQGNTTWLRKKHGRDATQVDFPAEYRAFHRNWTVGRRECTCCQKNYTRVRVFGIRICEPCSESEYHIWVGLNRCKYLVFI